MSERLKAEQFYSAVETYREARDWISANMPDIRNGAPFHCRASFSIAGEGRAPAPWQLQNALGDAIDDDADALVGRALNRLRAKAEVLKDEAAGELAALNAALLSEVVE